MEARKDTIIFEIKCHVPAVTHSNFMDAVRNLGIDSLGGYAERQGNDELWKYKGNLVKLGKCYFTVIADEEGKKVVLEPVEWKDSFKKLVDLPIEVLGRHAGQQYYFTSEESAKRWLSDLKIVDLVNFTVSVPGKYFGTAIMYLDN